MFRRHSVGNVGHILLDSMFPVFKFVDDFFRRYNKNKIRFVVDNRCDSDYESQFENTAEVYEKVSKRFLPAPLRYRSYTLGKLHMRYVLKML